MTNNPNSEAMEPSDTVQATDDLVAKVGKSLLRVQRSEATVMVYPSEIRHLIDALVGGGVRVVESQVGG